MSNEQKSNDSNKALAPAILVYHESARSIVFRDDLRRQRKIQNKQSKEKDTKSNMVQLNNDMKHMNVINQLSPVIQPLPSLELGPQDDFLPLMQSQSDQDIDGLSGGKEQYVLTKEEKEVIQLLEREQATVKTIRNADWTDFLNRFVSSKELVEDDKIGSFYTSTTLLPSNGKKMRCYGSTNEYTVGVIFALPVINNSNQTLSYFDNPSIEDIDAKKTKTYSWPSGYSAKTEFNLDKNGNLINGREEALVSMSQLRKYNHSYLHDKDHVLAGGRVVKGGLNVVPYNEVFLKVGGPSINKRSYEHGVGLPVALFVRSTQYGNLVSLLRTRARVLSILGKKAMMKSSSSTSRPFIDENIPLLILNPHHDAKVLTAPLQTQLLHTIATNLNPFQNPLISYKTGMDGADPKAMKQKMEELIDLDAHDIQNKLTPEERARLAGGFGATDDSVASLLLSAMEQDADEIHSQNKNNGKLQDIVNEGLSNAVRAGDYHTSRQLLILYTLVAAKARGRKKNPHERKDKVNGYDSDNSESSSISRKSRQKINPLDSVRSVSPGRCATPPPPSEVNVHKDTVTPTPFPSPKEPTVKTVVKSTSQEISDLESLAPPPPPPLDTDRLRSATNSDGLLAVLGAAEVLKSMQNGNAKRRVMEAISAMEEWVQNGEQSLTFRLASWHDQRVAQGDLKIATFQDSNMMAFLSNRAVSNRRKFATSLRQAVSHTDFQSLDFLQAIHKIVEKMQNPCLRLELLQYILGLDNRYSVAHVARSIELAATCLGLASHDISQESTEDQKSHSDFIESKKNGA